MWVQPREYVRVGRILAAARVEAGLTQQVLASRLRKPQSFVSNYEKGQRRIDVLEFRLIVEALGGDPLNLFKRVCTHRTDARRHQGP